jgi:hypothetical protein
MQSPAVKSAFVQFMVSLDVREPAAIAIANKNDDHPRLLMRLYSIVKGATREELGDLISKYLNLPQALDGEKLGETMEILEDFCLVTQASISSGKQNPEVQKCRRTMLDHAEKYCGPHQIDFLDDLLLQYSVTFYGLMDTKGTPAGVMGVFPEVLRDHISSAIPNATALLEHLLAEAEAARAARKRAASADEASGDEASAEDETGFTSPEPSGMSDRERKRLQCAPLKKPRADQE